MKNIIRIASAALLTVSVSACGTGNTAEASKTTAAPAETAAANSETTAESTPATVEEAVQEIEEQVNAAEEWTGEGSIGDYAVVTDFLSADGVLYGKVSYVRADSSLITEEVLNDWYFNHFLTSDVNFAIIAYTDQENTGAFASNDLVITGTPITQNEQGVYAVDGSVEYTPAATYYVQDEKLVKIGG